MKCARCNGSGLSINFTLNDPILCSECLGSGVQKELPPIIDLKKDIPVNRRVLIMDKIKTLWKDKLGYKKPPINE